MRQCLLFFILRNFNVGVLFLFLFLSSSLLAQQKYWVFLKDKTSEDFDPYSYFDKKAIERRQRNHLPLFDYSDLPVKGDYVCKVGGYADSISAVSRWFNAVVIYSDDDRIAELKKLFFVDSVKRAGKLSKHVMSLSEEDVVLPEKFKALLDYQTKVLGREDFEKKNISGKGARIAVLDAGFSDADENPVFDHLRSNKQILMTYDFVKKKKDVFGHASHGTMVLSCIAGMYQGRKVGLATNAEFLLARTEHNLREPFSEEEHWVEAAEWADKNGADIINSSLGYTQERYFQSDLDGKTSLVSRAATIAARKGILVVNAAGNEGTDSWKKLGVPADADSILTVGGINPYSAMHVNFSSYGPTADKRMKPNVSSPGIVIAASGKKLARTEGTSFSSPLMAGFAACVFEMHPTWTCMELLTNIEKSGRLYPYYDYAHGYGIPRAAYFTDDIQPPASTFTTEIRGNHIMITPDSSMLSKDLSDLVYYHVRDTSGFIYYYSVLHITPGNSVDLDVTQFMNRTIAIHFKGFTTEILLK